MFAIGRMPGWIAHWKEIHDDPKGRIYRPRQVYVGPVNQKWIPREERTYAPLVEAKTNDSMPH